MRILVVEDEKDLRNIIKKRLVREHYSVDACGDGEEALDYMEMSTLLSSGISTIDALETVAKIVNNIHYTNALMKAREEVMKGIPLSEPLVTSGIFPPMVCHMTGIGEETGNIEDMLEKLADYYDEEVEMTTQSVLAAMEPLIIVFIALVVGTLVIAVISPIKAMYNGLDNL